MDTHKVNAKEVLTDILSGKDDQSLMNKYQLSEYQLNLVFDKLIERGLVLSEDLADRKPVINKLPLMVWECSSCHMPQPHEFETCPQCGIIVDNFLVERQSRQASQASNILESQTKVSADSTPCKEPESYLKLQDDKMPYTEGMTGRYPKPVNSTMVLIIVALVVVGTSVLGVWLNSLRQENARRNAEKETNQSLIEASKLGSIQLMRSLIDEKVDVNTKDNEGDTPLIWASRGGNVDAVNLLLERGADTNYSPPNGNTALIVASENGRSATVSDLITKGARINAMNTKQETPLVLAAKNGYSDVAEVLLNNNADYTIRDSSGLTALDWARMKGHEKIATSLNRLAEALFAKEQQEYYQQILPPLSSYNSPSGTS